MIEARKEFLMLLKCHRINVCLMKRNIPFRRNKIKDRSSIIFLGNIFQFLAKSSWDSFILTIRFVNSYALLLTFCLLTSKILLKTYYTYWTSVVLIFNCENPVIAKITVKLPTFFCFCITFSTGFPVRSVWNFHYF